MSDTASMSNTCPRCQSTKLIPRVPIVDQGQFSDGRLKAHVADRSPHAFVLKDAVHARLFVTICGECGHAELSAMYPEMLYAAWLKEQKG